jgi:hypothetical protein
MRRHQVRCLLMGGQACVSYGAAEFSRDIDLAILADLDNLIRLRAALRERALAEEQEQERARDRDYWRPLRAEIEQLTRRRD